MEKKLLFFDVETNGFVGSSVLSFSAILLRLRLSEDKVSYKVLEKYDRYYYPKEAYNKSAIDVNGLTKEVIDEKRKDVTYSEYFENDDCIIKIMNKADLFVAHNIKFDSTFMPVKIDESAKYCTMLANVDICKIPHPNNRRGFKWPKLMECIKFYNIEYDENELHNSLYDVEMTLKVFLEMLKDEDSYKNIEEFLKGSDVSSVGYDI